MLEIGRVAALATAALLATACGRLGFEGDGEPGPSRCIKSVKIGDNVGCALLKDNTVWCWGKHSAGAFGAISDDVTPLPQQILDTPQAQIADIDVGEDFVCARTEDDGVHCWGANSSGQLGTSNTGTASGPSRTLLPNVVDKVSTAGHHACAIVDGDSLLCWGAGSGGELGDGQSASSGTPVAVEGFTSVPGGILDVSGGHDHTCAIKGDGTVWCWGENESGQLGNGTRVDSAIPVPVVGITDVVDLACYHDHCCAVKSWGTVACWGNGSEGQLGTGLEQDEDLPRGITLPGPARTVSTGTYHSCAVLQDNRVYCWGANSAGRLGNGNFDSSPRPNQIPDFLADKGAIIDSGGSTTVLHTPGRGALVWGSNAYGEHGNGTRSSHVTPTPIDSETVFSDIDAGGFHTCALGDDGFAYCWGYSAHGQSAAEDGLDVFRPQIVPGIAGIKLITTGLYHSCAVTDTDRIYCWGYNSTGQLGYDGATSSPLPIRYTQVLDPMSSMEAGDGYTCGLTEAGEVWCWGDGAIFGSGDGARQVILPSAATQLTAGASHTCALVGNGEPYCWGVNLDGQLGDGTKTSRISAQPVDFSGVVVEIAAGYRHTCLRDDVGQIYCWGRTTDGQLGNGVSGSTTADVTRPLRVLGLTGTKKLGVGRRSTCVVDSADKVYCWGENSDGLLATGTLSIHDEFARSTHSDVTDFAIGVDHMCAINSEGAVHCSGDERLGQMGMGERIEPLPRPIYGLECP